MLTEAEKIFVGGGQMGALMRSHDWSQTLLGPLEMWPQSLRTAVSICLNSRFPMVIWWGEELVVLYNDAWGSILGTKHPQALGKPGREVWAEIWDIIGVQLNSVLKTGQATWSDDFLLLVDRFCYIEETYFTYSYSPIFLESGEVGGAFTPVNETTQRVIGERRLGTLRELSAQIGSVKSVEETCSLATSRLTTNPHDIPFALLYLVENEGRQARLVGTTGLEMDTPASPQQINLTQPPDRWNLNQVNRTGEAKLMENLVALVGLLPGGVWKESAHSALVLPIGQSGKQHLAGFIILGISPRRAFDDEYRGFFELVAGQVTIMIANAKAYEDERKRAEALAELDRAKTAFFSNVSHEFRTPLTLMLGPLQDLLSVADDTPFVTQRQSLELIHRNALRLLKLVNTLLDFSRIEAGRIQATYEALDLASFTSELASVFRSAIEQEGGMRLVLNCPPLSEPVYVDREMWEKIVFNLLSNAFKFTFAGEITVTLRSAHQQVELLVSDTGIGISADELPHIFERFHRVKEAKGRTFEGTGIGLSLVQDLVRLHGGSVDVTSTVGQGSCFKVTIPKGSTHLPQDRISLNPDPVASNTLRVAPLAKDVLSWLPDRGARKVEENTSEQPHPPSSPARILLADDNADMREYIKRLLSESYHVETAVDGVSALATINQQPPDLVVTDLMMPGLDGLELLQEVRANPKTREIPIILLSARAGEESRVEGLKYGADDYLIKPFSARELVARVEANLKMAQMRQEATQREQALRIEAQAAKEQMASVLNRIDDHFFALDRQWNYTYINNRVVEVVGIPAEELLGKNIWEVFPDLMDSQFYIEVHRAMAEQVIVQFEYFYAPWQHWFENRVYPSVHGVSIFSADITERKQTEDDLQKQKLFLQNLTNSVPVLLWTALPDGTMDFVSQPWIEYTGMDLAEVNRQGWSNLIHPDDLAKTIASWTIAWQRRQPYEMTHRVKRADGSYNWCISRAVLTGDEELNSLRWVGTAIDIEREKQIELILRETTELLEKRNEELDSFAYVVSHDLKAPLRAIANLSQWLEDDLEGQLNPENQHQMQLLRQRVYRMESLINGLLEYSRADRTSQEAEMVDVGELLSEVIDSLAPPSDFTIHIQSNMPRIITKRLLLNQIFANLLSNAIKHHDRTDGKVEISFLKQGNLYEFAVSDDGPGIDPIYHEKIFGIFQTLKPKDTQENTGIGLSIVKKIIETEGGQIRLESQLGQGTTFYFTLLAQNNLEYTANY